MLDRGVRYPQRGDLTGGVRINECQKVYFETSTYHVTKDRHVLVPARVVQAIPNSFSTLPSEI